jgi:hypothetical protein
MHLPQWFDGLEKEFTDHTKESGLKRFNVLGKSFGFRRYGFRDANINTESNLL